MRLTERFAVCMLGLLAALPAYAGEGSFVLGRGSAGGLIAHSQDPNCPGCRAFLAGYGPAEGGPSCSCTHPHGVPGELGAAAAGVEADMGDELFASDYGAGYGYESSAPGMIGDFFGGGYQMFVMSAGQGEPTNMSLAGGDRRFKIAENYSPFPLNRVFFNYNHFHNALLTADGRQANFNRGVFGVETTFFDELWSFEFRLPFGSGLNGDQIVDPLANNVSGEFGNISLALKRLLFRRDTLAASAGLGVALPTGSDTNLFGAGSIGHVLTVENEAFYLQPFVGLLWTPNDQFFAQFAAQADIDANGNTVDFTQIGTTPEGVIQDQALLFLDASFGYWLFRDPYSDAIITGLAPMIEFHYSTTLEDSDVVDASDTGVGSPGIDQIRNFRGQMDVLNLTAALRCEIANVSYLTVFGVAPLRTDDDKVFDAEFGVQYTRVY